MEGLVYAMRQGLESPGFRLELIYQLKDFADTKMQKQEFCSKERDDAFSGTVKEPIECIFDKCFEDGYGYDVKVGDIFRSKDEINQMRQFGETLRKMQAWIYKDGYQKDGYYMDSPLWKEVTRSAKKTYNLLMKDEDLDSLREEKKIEHAKIAEERAKKGLFT